MRSRCPPVILGDGILGVRDMDNRASEEGKSSRMMVRGTIESMFILDIEMKCPRIGVLA